MSKAYMFISDGFEEVEGLMTVDLLRRAGIDTIMVSIQKDKRILGSNQIRLEADCLFEETDLSDADLLILPGGMPGTKHLDLHEGVRNAVVKQAEAGKLVAAICAAPSVLAHLGLLKGKKAACFPDFRAELKEGGAEVSEEKVVWDGNLITARGLGAATEFGLTLIEVLQGKEAADQIGRSVQWYLE